MDGDKPMKDESDIRMLEGPGEWWLKEKQEGEDTGVRFLCKNFTL